MWYQRVLDRRDAVARTTVRSKLLVQAGLLALFQGNHGSATALASESLAISQEIGDRLGTANALYLLARIAHNENQVDAGRPLMEQALALYRELGDHDHTALALLILGEMAIAQGRLDEARVCCQAALEAGQAAGDARACQWALGLLGQLAFTAGDLAQARSLFEEGVASCRDLGFKSNLAWQLGNLIHLALFEERYQDAQMLTVEWIHIYQELRNAVWLAYAYCTLAFLEQVQGHLAQATALYKEWFPQLDSSSVPLVASYVAGLVLTHGDAQLATRVLGALDQWLKAYPFPLEALDRATYEKTVEAARTTLGMEAFVAAWEEGQVMSLEQAIADALVEDGESRAVGEP